MEVTQFHRGCSHPGAYSKEFSSSACSLCRPDAYPMERAEPSSFNLAIGRIYTNVKNHFSYGEGDDKGRKRNIVGTFFNRLADIGENLFKLQASFFTKKNTPLSVTIVNDESLSTSKLFGDSSRESRKMELLANDKLYTCDTVEEKLSSIMGKGHDYFSETKETVGRCVHADRTEAYSLRVADDNVRPSGTRKNVPSNSHSDNRPLVCEINGTMESRYQMYVYEAETSNEPVTTKIDRTSNDDDRGISDDGRDFPHGEPSSVSRSDSDSPTSPKIVDSVLEISTSTHSPVPSYRELREAISLYYESKTTMISAKKQPAKQLRRKANVVAMGRGRGRAKSQLRRSGVNRTRHRGQRAKRLLAEYIRDNYDDTWRDARIAIRGEDSDLSLDDSDSWYDDVQDDEFYFVDSTKLGERTTIHFQEIMSNNEIERRLEATRRAPNEAHRNVPDTEDSEADNDDETIYDSCRSRLISESSVDSEDSCFIIFETESNACSTIVDSDETGYYEDRDDEGEKSKVYIS